MQNGMDRLKMETAAELGITNYDQIDKGLLPSRVNGMVGGMMVRKMITMAESMLEAQNQIEGTPVKALDLSQSVTQEDRDRVRETMQNMISPAPHQIIEHRATQIEYH